MKFNIKLFVLLFFAGIFFTACNKENIDIIEPIEEPTFEPTEIDVNNLATSMTSGTDDGLALNCIQINFPFGLILEDDSKITINTYNEYKSAIDAPAPNRVSDINYPVSGIDQNGEVAEFKNNGELGASFASCVPTDGWVASTRSNATIPAFLLNEYCFDLVYPVDLEDEDGNGYTAANEEEFIDLCATVDPLFFTLPLTVIDLDGNEVVLDNVASFFEALAECEGISPPVVGNGIQIVGFGCLTLNYPFDVALGNGAIQTINDEDEYATTLLSGISMELQYPFSLTGPEEEVVVINTFEDLIEAFLLCGLVIETGTTDACDVASHILLFFNQGFGSTGCGYNVDFPVQVEADGTIIDLESMLDYFDVFNNNTVIELVYPMNTVLEDGSSSSFISDEDLCEFMNNCG